MGIKIILWVELKSSARFLENGFFVGSLFLIPYNSIQKTIGGPAPREGERDGTSDGTNGTEEGNQPAAKGEKRVEHFTRRKKIRRRRERRGRSSRAAVAFFHNLPCSTLWNVRERREIFFWNTRKERGRERKGGRKGSYRSSMRLVVWYVCG